MSSVSRKLINRLLENSTNYVIVTEHPALAEVLQEKGLVPLGTPIVDKATPETVTGKNVIGTIPFNLAVLAETVTEIPLELTFDMIGKELDIDAVKSALGNAITYKVTMV